jgi:hypothetical protein
MPDDVKDGGVLGWKNWKFPSLLWGGPWDLKPSSVTVILNLKIHSL